MFLILKSNYLIAKNSIEEKKKERFQETIDEYYALVDEYTETKYLKEAEKIYKDSIKKIK